jgi:syntaxin 5
MTVRPCVHAHATIKGCPDVLLSCHRPGPGVHSKQQALQQHSEFAKTASQIGLGIHKTSVKLQKLAQLAKRTSMFDDPAQEINELTGIIKQDIQALNSNLTDLQRLSAKSREDNKQSADHSSTVVDNLRTRLKDATMEFKEVLTVRTDNLKAHTSRRQLFSAAPPGKLGASPCCTC